MYEKLDETSVGHIIAFLNEMLALDYDGTVEMVLHTITPCNKKLAETLPTHPLPDEFQVKGRERGITIMGMLNAMVGSYPGGLGRICVYVEAQCPDHGIIKDRAACGGNACPHCGQELSPGKVLKFGHTPPEEFSMGITENKQRLLH
jgi:hypothetical protein